MKDPKFKLFSISALCIFLILVTWWYPSKALDRASLVQSKIQTNLSHILPSTDFLVLVHRLDDMESNSSSSDSWSSHLKHLPGLPIAVDNKGNIVHLDSIANDYTGPLKITILMDHNVQEETFKTIQNVLPEMIGGLKDDDEVKFTRTTLRQVSQPIIKDQTLEGQKQQQAPITIQNNLQQPSSQSTQNFWNEWMKFLSILLVSFGFIVFLASRWMGGRESDKNLKRPPIRISPTNSEPKEEGLANQNQWSDLYLQLPVPIVSLYLLKLLHNKNWDRLSLWIEISPIRHQREVLRSFPSWVAAYFQEIFEKKPFPTGYTRLSKEDLMREISILENNLSSVHEQHLGFIAWFPSTALRFVPKQHLSSLSDRSRRVLWNLRPDLGHLVHVDKLLWEPHDSPESLEYCYNELIKWPSTLVVKNLLESANDKVRWWSMKINQLPDFGSIDSQLEQAKKELSQEQYEELENQCVSIRTPLRMSDANRRLWLRVVDPQDYFWWIYITSEKPQWDLEKELRPMKLAIFKYTQNNQDHLKWNETQKKTSSSRLLDTLRKQLIADGVEFTPSSTSGQNEKKAA